MSWAKLGAKLVTWFTGPVSNSESSASRGSGKTTIMAQAAEYLTLENMRCKEKTFKIVDALTVIQAFTTCKTSETCVRDAAESGMASLDMVESVREGTNFLL